MKRLLVHAEDELIAALAALERSQRGLPAYVRRQLDAV
jgi:hypothetical protein